jgi:cytoskeletal protein CcmA (bactofilin family)
MCSELERRRRGGGVFYGGVKSSQLEVRTRVRGPVAGAVLWHTLLSLGHVPASVAEAGRVKLGISGQLKSNSAALAGGGHF